MDIKKNFFNKRVVKHWNSLTREDAESPPWKYLKDVDMWHLEIWFNVMDLAVLGQWLVSMIIKVFSNLDCSMIL